MSGMSSTLARQVAALSPGQQLRHRNHRLHGTQEVGARSARPACMLQRGKHRWKLTWLVCSGRWAARGCPTEALAPLCEESEGVSICSLGPGWAL